MAINVTFKYTYGIFIMLSILFSLLIQIFMLKKKGYENDFIVSYIIMLFIGIVIGAKTMSYLTSLENENVTFISSGLSSYGGLIGGFLVAITFYIFYKKCRKDLLTNYIILLPLMYSIGKIGCFLVGCCYGIKYNGIGHIMYLSSNEAPLMMNLFPVQLLESIINLIIFLIAILIYKDKRINKYVTPFCLLMCSVSKLFLEFLRHSWNNAISVNQIISLIIFIVGIILFFKRKLNFGTIK